MKTAERGVYTQPVKLYGHSEYANTSLDMALQAC